MAIPPLNERYVVTADRLEKAQKIDAVLADALGARVRGLRMLDIGVGTGEIIDFFADHNQTFGVDVQDQRTSRRSGFRAVTGERLPHEDDTFDVVISNHVIEHVTDPELHLREVARVLRPGGLVYLATPNRAFPKETHFKLWLLHYLPDATYFRVAARLGRTGDRFALFTQARLERLFRTCGFRSANYTGRVLADPRRFHADALWPVRLGRPLGELLARIAPTFIYVLRAGSAPQ